MRIGVLGAAINAVIGPLVGAPLSSIAQPVAYLYHAKTYYEAGWGNANITPILTMITMAAVLALIGKLSEISLGTAYGPPF